MDPKRLSKNPCYGSQIRGFGPLSGGGSGDKLRLAK